MADHPGGLTRDHVIWAYRLLLDRDPENDDVVGPKLAGSRNTKELRHHFVTSAEYRRQNPDFAHANDPTVVIAELEGGSRLFVDLSDHVIGLTIVRGRYERDEMAFVRQALRAGHTAIDVGAHIGFFTIQMAALVGETGRIVAFEPFDANADLLERSIAENRFADRIRLQRAAVGSTSGTATLTFARETLNSGGAYLLRSGTASLAGNERQTVPLVALDEVDLPRPVQFIKMDVEGAEPQVVRGAERILREDRPVILTELHPAQLDRASGTTPDQFLAQVRALGYRTQTLDGATIDRAPADAIMSIVLVPDR